MDGTFYHLRSLYRCMDLSPHENSGGRSHSCSFKNYKWQYWQTDYWQKAKWAAGSVCPCLVATVKSHSTCQRNVIHLPQLQGFKAAPTMGTLCWEVKRGKRFPLPSSELLWSTVTMVPKHFTVKSSWTDSSRTLWSLWHYDPWFYLVEFITETLIPINNNN